MKSGKKHFLSTLLLLLVILHSCRSPVEQAGCSPATAISCAMADTLEESLFSDILDHWYPRNIDSLYGGYISGLERDWTPAGGSQVKALVQQARHLWATSRIYETYPEMDEYPDYAEHGYRFLRDAMWDDQSGGFHAYVTRQGEPQESTIGDKRIYGQAFGLYGLSQYYRISRDPEVLELAKKSFLWMEHARDQEYGGYFEMLDRNGIPVHLSAAPGSDTRHSPFAGIKDYNSSIHVMEAITELYRVWPDTLVRSRLEEMFYLIRDTFTHPDGFLQLYFHGDWTPVSDSSAGTDEGRFFTPHFTYGHDVETAFLLLETAHVLGWGEDRTTHMIAKKLVDHSLESGWDPETGGFFDAGRELNGTVTIVNRHKAWWAQVEGLNALLLMYTLYPDDPNDYYGKFLRSWDHIDNYLIDKEFGGWYNNALDTDPENRDQAKSHIWKTTYHNARGLLNCIRMLRAPAGKQNKPEEHEGT